MPRSADLEMVRGDTASWRMTLSRAGVPVPLPPGTLLWFTAKRDLSETDVAAVFRKTVGTGITVISVTDGVFDVDLVNADTQSLLDRDYQLAYDVQVKELSGRITTFRGKLFVTCDITEAVV